MLNPKVGDMVRLKPLQVVEVSPREVAVLMEGPGSWKAWLPLYMIEEIILAAPPKVGDMAELVDGRGQRVRIIAIHGDCAWVERIELGGLTTEPIGRLLRVDP